MKKLYLLILSLCAILLTNVSAMAAVVSGSVTFNGNALPYAVVQTGAQSTTCDANGAFSLDLSYGSHSFTVYHPNNQTLLLDTITQDLSTDSTLAVTKSGSSQSVTTQCFTGGDFEGWTLASGYYTSCVFWRITLPDGFGYISDSSRDLSLYNTQGKGSSKCIGGSYGEAILVFPIKGSGTNIYFSAKKTRNDKTSVLKFYKVTKNSDGSFTKESECETVDVSNVTDSDFSKLSYSIASSSKFSDQEYIGMALTFLYIDDLSASKSEIVDGGFVNFSGTAKSGDNVLPGITVTLSNGKDSYTATTDVNGAFNFYAVESSCTSLNFGNEFTNASQIVSLTEATSADYDLTYKTTKASYTIYTTDATTHPTNAKVYLITDNGDPVEVATIGDSTAYAYQNVTFDVIGSIEDHTYKIIVKKDGYYQTVPNTDLTPVEYVETTPSTKTERLYINANHFDSGTVTNNSNNEFESITTPIVCRPNAQITLADNYNITMSKDDNTLKMDAVLDSENHQLTLTVNSAENLDNLPNGKYSITIPDNTILIDGVSCTYSKDADIVFAGVKGSVTFANKVLPYATIVVGDKSATANENGEFAMSLPAGTYEFNVYHPNKTKDSVILTGEKTIPFDGNWDIAITPEDSSVEYVNYSGKIYIKPSSSKSAVKRASATTDSSDDTTLAGVTVTISSSDNKSSYTATTDEDGVFNFYSIDSSYNTISFGDDFTKETQSQEISLTNTDAETDTPTFDLQYKQTTISFTVTANNGDEISGATVYLYKEKEEVESVSTGGSNTASFEITGSTSGYTAIVKKAGYYQVATNSTDDKTALANGVTVDPDNENQLYMNPNSIAIGDKIEGGSETELAYITVTVNCSDGAKVTLKDDYNITLTKRSSSQVGVKNAVVTLIQMDASVTNNTIKLTRRFNADDWYKTMEDGTYDLLIPSGTIIIDGVPYNEEGKQTYSDVITGVDRVIGDEDSAVDIYTTSGVMVKRGVAEETLDQLPAGIYVVKGQGKAYKYLKR
jgi:hypothetical protein